MSYRVTVDNLEFLDYDDKTRVLIEPQLEDEINEIGSFEFKLPPIHRFFNTPSPYKSTVEVYEDEDLIWFGRVISVNTDYYRQKEIVCEGPLAWFQDTILRYHEYESVKVHTFFRDIITGHNLMAPSNRQFQIGNITVDNPDVYRKLDFTSSYDALMTMCVGAEGGYLFFRRVEGVNYIDWLKDMPYTCNQPVEFGLNLVDISSSFEGADLITAIIPLGDTVQANSDPSQGEIVSEDDDRVGRPLDLTLEYGTDIIASDAAVQQYGMIVRAVNFSGVKDVTELYNKGVEYLEEQLLNKMTFECTAVELKSFGPGANDNYDHFKLGQMVRCKSKPHALDAIFPLMKISIDLTSAEKQVTLGTMPHQTLTKIVNTNADTSKGGGGSTGGSGSNKPNGSPTNYGTSLQVDNVVVKKSDALVTSGAVAAALENAGGGNWNPIYELDFDFSHWGTGTLTETLNDQVVHHFSIVFDQYGRPTKITDSEGHESNISW